MQNATLDNRYDKRARYYDRSHARWLRYVGGEAQCALEGAVTALMRSDAVFLDAACGTGAMVRRLLHSTSAPNCVTLLDASQAMLDQCGGIPAKKVCGRLEKMPFQSGAFDIVTCAWGLETVRNPFIALAECIRVTRPDGHVCLAFCAAKPSRSLMHRAMRDRVTRAGLGRFLDPAALAQEADALGAKRVELLYCTGPAAAMILRA